MKKVIINIILFFVIAILYFIAIWLSGWKFEKGMDAVFIYAMFLVSEGFILPLANIIIFEDM